MVKIPDRYQDLLEDKKRAFLYLATSMEDGTPQVTPIWFNVEGDLLVINSAKGRVKDRNMRRQPRVALCIQDPADPYRYLQVRGHVVEITETGAEEHIKQLALKYTGQARFQKKDPAEIRVKYKIAADSLDEH
ncbi:PPOX class F420-dependent oxidoreductase [bacterium]|nr:PPOX class F420-dependent oxidoreductase [bacterium]